MYNEDIIVILVRIFCNLSRYAHYKKIFSVELYFRQRKLIKKQIKFPENSVHSFLIKFPYDCFSRFRISSRIIDNRYTRLVTQKIQSGPDTNLFLGYEGTLQRTY